MEGSHLPLAFCGLILGLFLNVVHVSSMFIDCPNNTFEATTGSIEVVWKIPTCSENFGITVTSSHPGVSSLNLAPSNSKTQVKYSAINDFLEIVDECIFNIYVVDSSGELPVIFDCPDDIHIEAPSVKDSVYVSWEEPRAVGEGGELRGMHTNLPEPAGTFEVGHYPLFYTWVDNENIQFQCSFVVTVTAPESNVTCPDDITREIPSRDVLLNVSWEEPRPVFENLTLLIRPENLAYGIFGVGIHEVRFSWGDNAGHTIECNFFVTITVVEYPPPEVIGCPDDIEREVLSNGDFTNVTWEEPGAESDAGRVSLQSQTHTSGTIFPVGNFRVVYTWKDIAGKTANCSFFVRVTARTDTTEKATPTPPKTIIECFLDLPLEVQVGIGAGLLVVIVCVITCLIMCCRCKSPKRRDRRTRRRRPQNPPPPYAPRPSPNEVPLKTSRANLGRELPRTPVPTPDEVAPPYVYETPIDDQEDYLQPREKPPSYHRYHVNNIGEGPPRSGYQY